MMATIMSEKYKESLLNGLTKEMSEKNPFIEDNGKTYMRYDMITLSRTELGEVIMKFYWGGICVMTKNTEGLMPSEIDITIDGIEGRVEINIC